jgi:hypothetical protein
VPGPGNSVRRHVRQPAPTQTRPVAVAVCQSTPRLTSAGATRVGTSHIRVRVEIMGPGKYDSVGKSQPVLIMINPRRSWVTAEKRRGHFCVAVRTSTASSAAISTCSIRAAVGSLALRGGATTYPTHPCASG